MSTNRRSIASIIRDTHIRVINPDDTMDDLYGHIPL